uniref:C-type lectin domain-containing protein n=1 Tax=Panagrolaimus davidi TaxID=227884 RepID=A0A914PZY5_9BILA
MIDNVFLSGEASTFFTDSADFWIGANKLFIPDNWSWSDGTLWNFEDFGKEDDISNCGAVQLKNGNWIRVNCLDVKPFSCLVNEPASAPTSTTTIKPTSCQPSWTYYNGFCYKAFANETWLNAQDRCKVDNANLTSIHTLEENLFIANLAYYKGVDGCDWTQQAWTGLFTEDKNAHWNWTDGTPFDYANWMVGKPNPSQLKKSCGFILLASCGTFKMGDFDNASCKSVLSRFVCKKLPN